MPLGPGTTRCGQNGPPKRPVGPTRLRRPAAGVVEPAGEVAPGGSSPESPRGSRAGRWAAPIPSEREVRANETAVDSSGFSSDSMFLGRL